MIKRGDIYFIRDTHILNGFHIDTYCVKYLRKAREAAEGTPEPTKKRRRR